jgi:hypothetical protein
VADIDSNGIFIFPAGSGAVTAVLNHVELNNNAANGLSLIGTNSTGQAPITLMLFHSVAANNITGVRADGTGATLRIANSMVTGNTNGWQAVSGGVVESYGDNYIDGNTSNEGPPPSATRK